MEFQEIDPCLLLMTDTMLAPHKLTMRWRSSYEYRMLFVKEGCLAFDIDSRSYVCAENSLIYWLPGSHYRITSISSFPCSLWVLAFDFVRPGGAGDKAAPQKLQTLYLDDYKSEFEMKRKSFENAPEFEKPFVIHDCGFCTRLFTALWEEYTNKKIGYAKYTDSQFLMILINIWRRLAFERQGSNSHSMAADKVLAYINTINNADAAGNLNCRSISEKLHYNHSYIGRLIHRATGITFHEYLQEIKIQKAVSLIEGSGISITEIAHMLGFSDTSHFTSVFRRKTGFSPAKLRKAALGKTHELI